MKVCKNCSDKLVVGKNWTTGYKKNYMYRCNKCRDSYTKKWCKENPEAHKKAYQKSVKKWNKKNNDFLKGYGKLYREKDGIGIYLIKYRWINFYVGEGQFLSRRNQHLKYTNPSASRVAPFILNKKINQKYLSFHVLENENDEKIRKQKEEKYIKQLKPYINGN